MESEASVADPNFVIDMVRPSVITRLLDVSDKQPPVMEPTVTIVEQPARKSLRFRYEKECRSFGTICGVNSIPGNKTYPTIRIDNFTGMATIIVSCVTMDEPYRPHPHNLVGKPDHKGFVDGVFIIQAHVTENANKYEFKHLGILNVKHNDVKESLKKRAEMNIDPFRTGFEHANDWKGIDLSAIRLAFQVFLHDPHDRFKLTPLSPVKTNVIYDKKTPDLRITIVCCSQPVRANDPIVLLCEKVNHKDTVVLVYEEDSRGNVISEMYVQPSTVHKQVTIVFDMPSYIPPYYHPSTHRRPIKMYVKLKRVSTNECSDSESFNYIPDCQGKIGEHMYSTYYRNYYGASSSNESSTSEYSSHSDEITSPCWYPPPFTPNIQRPGEFSPLYQPQESPTNLVIDKMDLDGEELVRHREKSKIDVLLHLSKLNLSGQLRHQPANNQ